ncbi:hypothetical protein AGOR_G00182240 [Albula goreensis]|uniref:Meiosis expressed gene 1 protein homolog n=1 Tax=Albula goreensis TaxID=1534307 RepID=A0A8T3CX48_9TELE|nr:hypothetical protein AGOR_G00182240 [Albula goreensis]
MGRSAEQQDTEKSAVSIRINISNIFCIKHFSAMSCTSYLRPPRPKSMTHASNWTDEVENLYRFQQAGYRDELEYKQVKQVDLIDRWPETGFVKKLQRRDNTFYYYNKKRECEDNEVHKVKVYAY